MGMNARFIPMNMKMKWTHARFTLSSLPVIFGNQKYRPEKMPKTAPPKST